ncbi:MAG TPA: endonuclease NucS [Alphaproteobacteria bacterium]|nr:endonuclease NucS [Alphaproteobacteria bacterium]
MRIGEMVQSYIRAIIDYCENKDRGEFVRLQEKGYCRQEFGLSFSFFKVLPFEEDHERYWVQEYKVQGQSARVCSQWVDRLGHREKFQAYLQAKGLMQEVEETSDSVNGIAEGNWQIDWMESAMQSALRHTISQLEEGLRIVDGGKEKAVECGRIDITAEDKTGALVVIELKTGIAGAGAVGQIMGYMGDLKAENPAKKVRGILVACDFDSKARSAAHLLDNLSLHHYRVNFEFPILRRSA